MFEEPSYNEISREKYLVKKQTSDFMKLNILYFRFLEILYIYTYKKIIIISLKNVLLGLVELNLSTVKMSPVVKYGNQVTRYIT